MILLLRGLELDSVLGLMAEGEPLEGSDLALRSGAARLELDEQLRGWEDSPLPAHLPVLLAWAAFGALSSKMEFGAGPDGAGCLTSKGRQRGCLTSKGSPLPRVQGCQTGFGAGDGMHLDFWIWIWIWIWIWNVIC